MQEAVGATDATVNVVIMKCRRLTSWRPFQFTKPVSNRRSGEVNYPPTIQDATRFGSRASKAPFQGRDDKGSSVMLWRVVLKHGLTINHESILIFLLDHFGEQLNYIGQEIIGCSTCQACPHLQPIVIHWRHKSKSSPGQSQQSETGQ